MNDETTKHPKYAHAGYGGANLTDDRGEVEQWQQNAGPGATIYIRLDLYEAGQQRVAMLEASNAVLRAALCTVEWNGEDNCNLYGCAGHCPECEARRDGPSGMPGIHAVDCSVGKALVLTPAQTGEQWRVAKEVFALFDAVTEASRNYYDHIADCKDGCADERRSCGPGRGLSGQTVTAINALGGAAIKRADEHRPGEQGITAGPVS